MIHDPYAEKVSEESFHVFARGLHEPLSLAERDGWLYVTQRPEVTRIRDEDGDGSGDLFETYADGWGVSGDYHEYAFGSKFDAEGNLTVALCLTGSFTSVVPFRGWAMRITPKGETIAMTSGVRSPGGIGSNAAGDLFYTDNQGPWNGTCSLKPLKAGKFVGHPGGFAWYDQARESMGETPIEPQSGSRIHIETERIAELLPPAVMFPYDKMGKSASGIACDTSGGKFGPFAGQLFVGDQSHSTIMRVFLEQVDGVYQGACFPFRKGFASGNVGVEMSPSGALFVGGTNRGWGSIGTRPFAIERLDWTGAVPFEIKTMRVQPSGFELEFTKPVDAKTAGTIESYTLSTYTYEYRSQYGSPEVDATSPAHYVRHGFRRSHASSARCRRTAAWTRSRVARRRSPQRGRHADSASRCLLHVESNAVRLHPPMKRSHSDLASAISAVPVTTTRPSRKSVKLCVWSGNSRTKNGVD